MAPLELPPLQDQVKQMGQRRYNRGNRGRRWTRAAPQAVRRPEEEFREEGW